MVYPLTDVTQCVVVAVGAGVGVIVSWCYGPFGFMMMAIVPLAFRSSILGIHELGGCAVTGGYSIIFWYICNAWMHLGVAL